MKYVYNRSQYVRVIERASEQKGSDYYEEAGFVDQLLSTLITSCVRLHPNADLGGDISKLLL